MFRAWQEFTAFDHTFEDFRAREYKSSAAIEHYRDTVILNTWAGKFDDIT